MTSPIVKPAGALFAAVFGLLGLSGVAVRPPTSAPPQLTTPFSTPAMACGFCDMCTDYTHRNPGQEYGFYNAIHSECWMFTCTAHGFCEPNAPTEDMRLEQLIDDVRRGDKRALRQLFEEFREQVAFNTSRGAIQVSGCSPETVAVHLPVSRALLGEIQELASPVGAL